MTSVGVELNQRLMAGTARSEVVLTFACAWCDDGALKNVCCSDLDEGGQRTSRRKKDKEKTIRSRKCQEPEGGSIHLGDQSKVDIGRVPFGESGAKASLSRFIWSNRN